MNKIKYMNKLKIYSFLVVILLSIINVLPISAQYMPVVFDNQYGKSNKIQFATPLSNNDVALVTLQKDKYDIVWVDKSGEVLYTLPLTGFTKVNTVSAMGNNQILVVGQGYDNSGKVKKKFLNGKVVVIDNTGRVITNFHIGDEGVNLLKSEVLRNGDMIFSGYKSITPDSKHAVIIKANKSGQLLYQYSKLDSSYCDQFVVLGGDTEYVCAGFSAEGEHNKGAAVRLDNMGKPYYIAELPQLGFNVTGISASINDGSVTLIGNSISNQGVVYKIRPEGDIVFDKKLGDTNKDVVAMTHLKVANNGNILVGGKNESKGFYALLRSDGTPLYTGSSSGFVSAMELNPTTGESVVTTYNPKTSWGSFICIQSSGNAEFTRAFDGHFDHVRLSNENEVLLLSSEQGRVAMYSATGDKEFDRFIKDNKAVKFKDAVVAESGELLFFDEANRLVKLGHGLYVSDVKITKPINGVSTAIFSVTLTGYSNTKTGSPIPVTVDYATQSLSANINVNYTPVSGKLSFTPSRGAKGRYLVNKEIEVPILANELIEGEKNFELVLSNVKDSYLVKPAGQATIQDQQALVKLISSEPGLEGSKDIIYQLGLFKPDGTPLKNATGANIIIDGHYGAGTADALDFDMGVSPRAIFASGSQKAHFNVKTIEDTRYELPKTVIVNFSEVHNLSTANISFESDVLSCQGYIIDQPALLRIKSLGDHRANSDVISGFFAISLVRASDGALLTNKTGSDIIIECVPTPDSSGGVGKDYVYTNLHDLRIHGGNDQSSVNVNGIVLFNNDNVEKVVKLKLDKVNNPRGAQEIGIEKENSAAGFKILKN